MCSGVIAEKTDDALFSLDLTGSNQIAKRENLTKKLKLDEILTTRSAVPAVSSKKRPSDSLGSGIYTKKKHRKDGVSHAHLQRLRALAYGKSTPDVKKSDAPSYDPWDDNAVAEIKPKGQVAAAGQAPVKVKEGVRTDFLEFKPPPKPPVTLKHEPVSLSANVKMPAVRLPDAGISYNPEFEKWEKLLREEGEKEVEREKERLRIAAEEERIQRLRDMSDEEPAEESESESESEAEEEDGENADGEALEVKEKKKVEARRKTTAQRNREAKQKAEQKAREEKRREKMMERELTLIKKYAKDVKAQERLRMARKMEEMARKVDDDRNPKVMRKKKFGKIPYATSAILVWCFRILTGFSLGFRRHPSNCSCRMSWPSPCVRLSRRGICCRTDSGVCAREESWRRERRLSRRRRRRLRPRRSGVTRTSSSPPHSPPALGWEKCGSPKVQVHILMPWVLELALSDLVAFVNSRKTGEFRKGVIKTNSKPIAITPQ